MNYCQAVAPVDASDLTCQESGGGGSPAYYRKSLSTNKCEAVGGGGDEVFYENIVTDPSFEGYYAAISAVIHGDWRDGVTLSSGDAGYTTGAWTVSGGVHFNKQNNPWGGSPAADGAVYVVLQTVASIEQHVTVVPGTTYTVKWKQRGRPGGLALNDINVSLGGTSIYTQANIADNGWNVKTSSAWTAPTGVTSPILKFYSTNPQGGDHSVFIDNISILLA
jgi:hypothetical protein